MKFQSTQRDVNDLEDEIAQLERGSILVEAGFQCDQVEADSRATVQRLLLQLRQTDLQMVRADINIRLAVAEVNRIRNRATRLIAEQTESEQLTIDLEAARNDPNVRIYRNDAVINADRSFYDAIRDAYRATRVFEYYTSQSYARRDELTLVRLVSRGDYNLENYLFDLQTAYYEFEDINGRPDSRVEIVSLRDDILRIPRSGTSGALSQAERTEMLRVELTDPRWLNPRGHISIPFAKHLTGCRRSPATTRLTTSRWRLWAATSATPLAESTLVSRGRGQFVHLKASISTTVSLNAPRWLIRSSTESVSSERKSTGTTASGIDRS
ncbi:MAG: hypothetical protein IPG81_12855 [Sandaracinaceae bacterium]|nr:hypothetical protein [Sandaracinaceae bacterium]